MPDWSYRTVFRPVLYCLPARLSRDLSLGFMGALAEMPWGRHVIEFMGHMRSDPRLACDHAGVHFRTRCGLGPALDVHQRGLAALSQFGFGFVEVGPVHVEPVAEEAISRRLDEHDLWRQNIGSTGLQRTLKALRKPALRHMPVIVRVQPASQEETAKLVESLAPHVTMFAYQLPAAGSQLDGEPALLISEFAAAMNSLAEGKPWLIVVSPGAAPRDTTQLVETALHAGACGCVVDGAVAAGDGLVCGRSTRAPSLACTRHVRAVDNGMLVIAGGGVHDAQHALDLREAGADLVQIDSGLVYSGPGLPKRINDAELFQIQQEARAAAIQSPGAPPTEITPAPRLAWFWAMLLSFSIGIGGIVALVVAVTRVMLPYDEAFVGMTLDEVRTLNPKLVSFLIHDRVTLAGTMMAAGILYFSLAYFGIRRGLHWAQMTIVYSAFLGFFGFFLFLGFGYFDPFHAFITAIQFQFMVLTLHAPLEPRQDVSPPTLLEDWQWRMGQWGQLIYVVHGAVLLCAGAVIAMTGISAVFVPQDLDFMGTTAAELEAANPRLIPMIAHDRATFGAMLVAIGVCVLLGSLWGFRRGYAWMWWSLTLAGLVAYLTTIIVHFAVGYTHFIHLLPAYAGVLGVTAGSALCYPLLCARYQTQPEAGG